MSETGAGAELWGGVVGVALWDTLRLLFLVEAIGIFQKGSNIIWFTF